MTSTEEIIVSGENFIERRIFLIPDQMEIEKVRDYAYNQGYKRGCLHGFLTGSAVIGAAGLFVWLALYIR
ncbi:MAG: hypothetical protein ACRD4Y_05660 [Candidatus Acidiferrales bacterium]